MSIHTIRETTYTFICDVCGSTLKIHKGDTLLNHTVLDINDARKLARLKGWILGKRVIKCAACSTKSGPSL